MKTFKRSLLPAALLLAFTAVARAQPPAPDATPQLQIDVQRVSQEAHRAAQEALEHANIELGFIGQEMGRSRVVKGAPYCADAVHETIQPLADGNRIVRVQTDRQCRDGEGRTRTEVDRDGKRVVYLRDPLSKENWVLDPESKTASKAGNMAWMANDEGQWRAFGQQMREMAVKIREQLRSAPPVAPGLPPAPGVPPKPPVPPLPPEPVVLTEDIHGGDGKDGREVRVQIVRMGDAKGMPPLPALQAPPAVLARTMAFAPRGEGATTALPAKEIEGVKVNGERTSWTIEAGKIGNEKPIVITRDVWTSPELMLTVSSRDFDPRSGETNYRLQNIRRGEPEAALMKVPADYKKAETRQEVRVVRERLDRDGAAPAKAPKAASKP
ncbi:MAG: hypothetical protein JO006_07145 [Paucibacter sp.]|nr:hypothetical protein [Roseateles sp.]